MNLKLDTMNNMQKRVAQVSTEEDEIIFQNKDTIPQVNGLDGVENVS